MRTVEADERRQIGSHSRPPGRVLAPDPYPSLLLMSQSYTGGALATPFAIDTAPAVDLGCEGSRNLAAVLHSMEAKPL